MSRDPLFLRLEPARPAGDNERGFAAELADPAWLLARQWQLGEHQGENASSPLTVHLTSRHVRIDPLPSRPDADPQKVPAEAIVEAAPDDWWTIGRRARLGSAAAAAGLPAAAGADVLFDGLTAPYDVLNRIAVDGKKVHALSPGDPVFAEVPPGADDLWHTDTLAYSAAFPAGGTTLTVGGVDGGPTGRWGGHDGGDVDWWSVDAGAPLPADGAAAEHADRWPDRFRWPGAPAARWWQIEDHTVDLGGMPPDRAHLASTLLLDLIFGHADDWFLVPVGASLPDGTPAGSPVGTVLSLEDVTITDSFDEEWPKAGQPWAAADDWTMFRVTGLGPRQLPIWPVAAAPLVGPAVEEVVVGIDEDANLAWAVEERLAGRVTDRTRPEPMPPRVVDEGAHPEPPPPYHYEPMTAVPHFWYPYTREARDGAVRFVQGHLLRLDDPGADVPSAHFLKSRAPGPHDIAPWRLPPTGVRLEARPVLARTTTGAPVLWLQRRRQPLLAMPSSGLRFDAVTPTDAPAPPP